MTLVAEKTNATTPVHNVINNKEETMLPFDSNILSFKDLPPGNRALSQLSC